MRFTELTKNPKLATLILDTLGHEGITQVLVNETTNEFLPMEQRRNVVAVYNTPIGRMEYSLRKIADKNTKGD